MEIRVEQLVMPLTYKDHEVAAALARQLGVAAADLSDVAVTRRALDARAFRGKPVFVLTVEARLPDDVDLPGGQAVVEEEPSPEPAEPPIPPVTTPPVHRPVVVGAGPAGLMAALALAQAGLRPLLLERGAPAPERSVQVGQFWTTGRLDGESNALFGEGGAGLFSDGKLTARGKDRPNIRRFFQTLVDCGAPADILIDAEPHLGSDMLLRLVPALRRRIESAGGEIRFHARLDDLVIERGRLVGVVVNGQGVEASACILACGHSARDVYRMLQRHSVAMEAKPFAVGVRLEIPQCDIDRSQYGRWAGHPRLGAASFRLTRREEGSRRPCYTFCMCPGGEVIACAAEPGLLTTNGMSLSTRGKPWGNAAFLVPVTPADYPAAPEAPPALAGLEFQARIERRAFELGGGDYSLPASPLADFLAGQTPSGLPAERSCPRSRPANLREALPDYVADALAHAITRMLAPLRGVDPQTALLYAAETRSSSPVRIVRGPDGQSVGTAGLLPAGEGAGYAGGIVSSALDGLKAAEALLRLLGSGA